MTIEFCYFHVYHRLDKSGFCRVYKISDGTNITIYVCTFLYLVNVIID